MLAQLCLTLAIPWNAARQAPLSMGFPRQEYWSGLPFPSPGHLPDPGIEPASLSSVSYTGRRVPLGPKVLALRIVAVKA